MKKILLIACMAIAANAFAASEKVDTLIPVDLAGFRVMWTKAQLGLPTGGSYLTGTGLANRVAYWTGTSTLSYSNNLQFNGTTLNFGNSSKTAAFLIKNTGVGANLAILESKAGTTLFQFDTTGILKFGNNSSDPSIYKGDASGTLSSSGRALVFNSFGGTNTSSSDFVFKTNTTVNFGSGNGYGLSNRTVISDPASTANYRGFTDLRNITYVGTGYAAGFVANPTFSISGGGTYYGFRADNSTGVGFYQGSTSTSNYFGGTFKVGGVTTLANGAKSEVVSTTLGTIPEPLQTTAERTAISPISEGVRVFDTDQHRPFYYTGSKWLTVGNADTVYITLTPLSFSDSVKTVQELGTDFFNVPSNLNGYTISKVEYAVLAAGSGTGSVTVALKAYTSARATAYTNGFAQSFSTGDIIKTAAAGTTLTTGQLIVPQITADSIVTHPRGLTVLLMLTKNW